MKTQKHTALLRLNGPFTFNPSGDYLETTETECKKEPLQWQKRGLQYTATGYGRRIPTEWKVKHNNRWKRVYCCIYSNSGACYIEQDRKPVATVDIYSED